jgi:predicted RNA-binding protein with EMAP domain
VQDEAEKVVLYILKKGVSCISKVDFQPVVAILQDVIQPGNSDDVAEKLGVVIEKLDGIKEALPQEQEEIIDAIDEIQDYLDFILTTNDSLDTVDRKEEIADIISELQRLS